MIAPRRTLAETAGSARNGAWRGQEDIMADDITPLRGEGRTVGRITGLWGELMAEFIGVFVLISFGDGVVAVAVAGLPGSGRTSSPTTIFDAGTTSSTCRKFSTNQSCAAIGPAGDVSQCWS